MAAWEALLLPDWRWEAFEKEEDEEEGLYFGRVRSPNTYGDWEWGYFTQSQLEEAGAYRVDTEIESEEDVFPDGGYELSEVFETELSARYEEFEEEYRGDS